MSLPHLPIRPVAALAREKKTWSPILLAGVLWRAVCSVAHHRTIRDILELPEYSALSMADPRFGLKYLTHGYLASWLSVTDRAACFHNHYTFLYEKLRHEFLARVLREAVPLVEINRSEHRFVVTLGLSRAHDKEGELSLHLEVDGDAVFNLSFTVVPGRILRSHATHVLLISRIQGVKGRFHQISMATKAMAYVSPPDLLLAALQGVGEGFGIDVLACISGADQNSYREDLSALFASAYDDFFTERVVAKKTGYVFMSPLPIVRKPLSHLTDGHKLRARKRREFKSQITDCVRQVIVEICQVPTHQFAEIAWRHDCRSEAVE